MGSSPTKRASPRNRSLSNPMRRLRWHFGAVSSAVRALASHARGRRFKSSTAHTLWLRPIQALHVVEICLYAKIERMSIESK